MVHGSKCCRELYLYGKITGQNDFGGFNVQEEEEIFNAQVFIFYFAVIPAFTVRTVYVCF